MAATSSTPQEKRQLRVLQPSEPEAEEARVEPPVRAEGALRAGNALLLRIDSAIDRVLPESLNPLAQTGAIANTTFIAAIVSGVVLLVWYSPSLHHAYPSVAAMAPHGLAGFVRALHRYASDACMFFVLVHAMKLFFARRFGGARWLAWVTGAFLVGTLWLVGWLGYWLVWDERSREVALGTARLLDALPIFADPLSRSFLTDDGMSSLLFFVVFFVHMLIPLAMGIALWLHITRLSRPNFLTKWRMTAWVLGSLAILAAIAPADLAPLAHMGVSPSHFRLDGWFLAPLGLTDRLGAGALWSLALGVGLAFYSVPWALAKGRARVAVVNESRCNACENCYKDCPYDAITMGPRTDDKPHKAVAVIDPSKCIGCGICAGSCDSAGIGLPWFDVIDKRADLDRRVDEAVGGGRAPMVAFVCGESAGGVVGGLPGYVVMRVPCAGWVHPLTVERAIRHGARGVLVVACGSGTAMYREGGKWTHARMDAQRDPKLNTAKVDGKRVRVIEMFRGDRDRLFEEAARFSDEISRASGRRPWIRWPAGLLVAAMLTVSTWAASRARYDLPRNPAPELVVSFKHPGQKSENCRDLTEEEKRKIPPHMRPPQICERKRNDVRMRVAVDERVVLDKAYAPAGLWNDGNSLAVERLAVPAGKHRVRVWIGDGPDREKFDFQSEEVELDFEPHELRVVKFDRTAGFVWR